MRKILPLLFTIFCTLSFTFSYKPFELIGKVTSHQGFPIPNTYVQIWDQGEVIAQTKTDNFGNYVLPLPKIGEFTIMAGNKNKYFHPKKMEEYNFHMSTQFKEDFKLEIDKQVLQEECTRLRESYRHMIHNPKNLSYRRSFLSRFPNNGLELELFFSNNVKEVNLKKEAKRYINTVFQQGFAGRTTYMILFTKFAQKTDMRVADKQTRKFYEGAVYVINENKEILFKELENTSPKKVKNMFVWMFSGGAFGTKKMTTSFDHLEAKYPQVYAIMLDAFDVYLNGES